MWVVDIECRRIGPQVDAGYDTCFLITSGTSGRRSKSAPPRQCTREDLLLAWTCEPYRGDIEVGDGILRMLCWAP
jgi:hypothetical protein